MERVLVGQHGEGSRPSRASRHAPVELEALDEHVSFLKSHAIEPSTKAHYSTGARDWIKFCKVHGLSEEPTESTMCRYIAYTSRHIASAPKYLSGARHYLKQRYPQFDDVRASDAVKTTIRGSRKVRGDPLKRKPPIRTSHLESALSVANKSGSYDDLLFATLLSCGTYGCHRAGELTNSNQRSFRDPRKVIQRSSLHFTPSMVGYRLPYNKSDPFYRGCDVLLATRPIACPRALLSRYVRIRDAKHGIDGPLFLTTAGEVPTRRWFEKRLHSLLGRSFGGHSMRPGGATFYASLGLSEATIQALGRWSSGTWQIYLRDHPAVRAALELARVGRS